MGVAVGIEAGTIVDVGGVVAWGSTSWDRGAEVGTWVGSAAQEMAKRVIRIIAMSKATNLKEAT